jgi:hypothetical protein
MTRPSGRRGTENRRICGSRKGGIAVIKTDTNRAIGFLRWPTPRAKRWVKDFLSTVESDPNILAVIAMGSSVRPNVTSLDLDLVVICRDSIAFAYCPPMEVDVRKFDAASARQEIQSGSDLLGWCVKFGVVLFDRSKFWNDILREYSNNLPFPSAEVARERAEITKQRAENLLEIGDTEAALEQNISYFTHLARAILIEHAVYPASRPELPHQLRAIGETKLADEFSRALKSYRQSIAS